MARTQVNVCVAQTHTHKCEHTNCGQKEPSSVLILVLRLQLEFYGWFEQRILEVFQLPCKVSSPRFRSLHLFVPFLQLSSLFLFLPSFLSPPSQLYPLALKVRNILWFRFDPLGYAFALSLSLPFPSFLSCLCALSHMHTRTLTVSILHYSKHSHTGNTCWDKHWQFCVPCNTHSPSHQGSAGYPVCNIQEGNNVVVSYCSGLKYLPPKTLSILNLLIHWQWNNEQSSTSSHEATVSVLLQPQPG